jgi:hypothetical protein
MKVRRKSLWRSQTNTSVRKFANMRAAKERKRLARLSAEVARPDLSHVPRPRRPIPLFVVTIRCRDGESVALRVHDFPERLLPSPTAVAKKVAAVLTHYRPA